jgi:hypothetical protein
VGAARQLERSEPAVPPDCFRAATQYFTALSPPGGVAIHAARRSSAAPIEASDGSLLCDAILLHAGPDRPCDDIG